MSSESDESTYTVHKVHRGDQGTMSKEMEGLEKHQTSSPLARYYRLGTQERHAFDEHMRQLRQQVDAVERERQFRVSHPFHPKTCSSLVAGGDAVTDGTMAGSPSRVPCPSASDTGSLSSPSRVRPVFDRLAAQAVQLEMRRRHREEQQRRAEAASLRGAFEPHINHTAPIYAERLKHIGSVPVEERLLHYGEFVARERKRKQDLKELEQAMAWQSTKEAVTGAGTSHARDPEERRRQREEFLARNDRFLTERTMHLKCAEAAANAAFTFQPRISATSAALDEARQRCANDMSTSALGQLLNRSVDAPAVSMTTSYTNGGRRSESLYALAVARQRQRMQTLEHNGRSIGDTIENGDNGKAAKDPKVTHQPLTNPTSEKWIANGAHGPFFQEGFVRRQALYEEVKREEAALRATATQGPALSSSKPATHKVDAKQLTQRLYYSAKKAREAADRRRQALLSARECPFRPQLSPGTKYVLAQMPSRDRNVVKRLTSQSGRKSSSGVRDTVDKELYGPVPVHQLSLEYHSDGLSQRRETEGKHATDVVQDSPGRRASQLTVSARTEPRGVGANCRVDDPPPQQQQRKQHGRTLTLDQVERFYERQMAALQQRKDLIQERREGKAVEELVECTFRPRTNTDRHACTEEGHTTEVGHTAVSVSNVTGVSAFLQRQALARVRKSEHDELVRTLGLPRNTRVGSHGTCARTTVLSPFKFQTETRQHRSLSCPVDTTRRGEATSFSMTALTTAERELHEAIEQSRRYPGASSQAPLFPLPGYEQASQDSAHIDGCGQLLGGHEETEEPTAYMSPPRLSTERKGCDEPTALGVGYERPSLFSLISPNSFTGRNLGSAACNSANEKETPVGCDVVSEKPSRSLLKGSKQQPTTLAKRHKRHCSVSFADETIEAPLEAAPHTRRKSFADPAHLAFLSGEL